MTEILSLSQLPAPFLPALADLHCATMPTLLTDLGQPFVLRYYQLAQKDASVVALVAQDSSTISGYALGSPDPSVLNAQLRTPLPWFARQMLRLVFTRPGVLFQLAQSIFSASDVNTLQPGQIELTYIGVAPEARGQGLGKTILAAFVGASCAAGYKSVVLSVETDNPAAIALYTKFGFTITKTFTEGRYHRNRMEYQIAGSLPEQPA